MGLPVKLERNGGRPQFDHGGGRLTAERRKRADARGAGMRTSRLNHCYCVLQQSICLFYYSAISFHGSSRWGEVSSLFSCFGDPVFGVTNHFENQGKRKFVVQRTDPT